MTQVIGPCQFADLPKFYQDQFISGNIKSFIHYHPCKLPQNAIFTAIFFGLAYLLPSLYLIIHGTYTLIKNPSLVERIYQDLTSGLGFLLVGLVIFAVIVFGLYKLLKMAWFSLVRAYASIKINHDLINNTQHYGLLLDAKNLVLRHGEHFDDYVCAILPKDSIKSYAVHKIRVWFPKHSYNINVVTIEYVNNQNELQKININERFDLDALAMKKIIHDWVSNQPNKSN
ncbi:MAG: hypothetical protein AB8B80_09355 [Marinicellaceae bacterium]